MAPREITRFCIPELILKQMIVPEEQFFGVDVSIAGAIDICLLECCNATMSFAAADGHSFADSSIVALSFSLRIPRIHFV
jgi:hypothetical protein